MVQVIDVNKAAIKWQRSSSKGELLGSLGQFISASETGKQFDPSIVAVFLDLVKQGKI